MTEIISGLWLGNSNSKQNKEILSKIDIPFDCNFKNQQYLSVDLEIEQFLSKLNYFTEFLKQNLNLYKNILIYNSNKQDRIEKSQIILIYFLIKYCQISFKTALKLTIGKTKKILFNNEYYKIVFQKLNIRI